jgi:oligopeptide transport system ATP-binding protein
MQKLSRDTGTATIIITHNLGVVARYAQRVNVMYAGRIIERADAGDLYSHPLHPYTLGLLHSVPRLDEALREKLDPIEGLPPDLINLPPGCPFVPRCKFVKPKCMEEYPPLMEVAKDHTAACWVDVTTGELR